MFVFHVEGDGFLGVRFASQSRLVVEVEGEG